MHVHSEIPNSPTRDELRSYARDEFERHRNVTDLVSEVLMLGCRAQLTVVHSNTYAICYRYGTPWLFKFRELC